MNFCTALHQRKKPAIANKIIGLTFKKWKSYANLYSSNRQKIIIDYGLIWGSISAQLTHLVKISTHIASMYFTGAISQITGMMLHNMCRLREVMSCTLKFLVINTQSHYPKYDQLTDPKKLGFEEVFVPLRSKL